MNILLIIKREKLIIKMFNLTRISKLTFWVFKNYERSVYKMKKKNYAASAADKYYLTFVR